MSIHILKILDKNLKKNKLTAIRKIQIRNEFHISQDARDKYQFDEMIFASNGNVIFANFHAAREFSQKINEKRDLLNFPEQAVKAGQINALGLVDEILHYVVALYSEQNDPNIFEKATSFLKKKLGKNVLNECLIKFVQEFPPIEVYKRKKTSEDYFNGETDGQPHSQIVLEELLLLWLANKNPAFSPYLELFDDAEVEKFTAYRQLIDELGNFFEDQSKFGQEKQNLIEMLQSPAKAVPHSLSGQLHYMLDKWGILLGKYLFRLLGGLDLIKEEEKMRFAFGPGPSRIADFRGLEDEPERFSPDKDWMPNLVLIAKSTLVWLDQLSKKYQRHIYRLDQIPDEELDQLANWGFTGLWLIGVWERSSASKKIKQYCGNPEAESSAYSLYDYIVSHELGGEAALQSLKERCWQRGIRLASDMVPNHTGIYSKWVIEHPDWFIAQDYSPFPAYSFNSADLSENPGVGVFIDDHYYERTDAAVAFKRVDYSSGDVKYIYHGNDGTSMPWNDTAQLNYLNPEVREGVIQTILHVARMFPIIRFDAAMTLAKKHYQRLWFPEPGTGGDIPSRAEQGLTKEQFDTLFPVEFWREVVDRVAQELPDTLLLAEAFWLMEGYFVRTLGMHRVYNSAFMNMLKNEENEKYRSVIKKTIEFNPEILKRYVNFMNNPDEETAVAQFGKGDKYIGTCIMMLTMPGLPMFGHGQIEGFTEKYGMEYRKAYWDEQPDWDLIQRHERYVFPLIKKRYLFAEVQNFLLYDFYAPEGHVNENVFSYSNRQGNERTLVVYNNKFENAVGWIRTSAAFVEKTGFGTEQRLVQKTLGEGLLLQNDESYFTIFSDHITGLEYIRSSKDLFENGLYIELGAFHYHVFWKFREVCDNEWHHYAQLNSYLTGRGVPKIDEALKELFLRPIHQKFVELLHVEQIKKLIDVQTEKQAVEIDNVYLNKTKHSYLEFIREIKHFTHSEVHEEVLADEFADEFRSIASVDKLKRKYSEVAKLKNNEVIPDLIESDAVIYGSVLYGWSIVNKIGKVTKQENYETQSRSWIDEWLLSKNFVSVFQELGMDEQISWRAVAVIKILTTHQNWFSFEDVIELEPYKVLKKIVKDQEVQQYLQFNRHQGILWFNKELFESLIHWLYTIAIIECSSKNADDKEIINIIEIITKFYEAEEKSDFQVEKLLRVVRKLG